LSEEIKKRIYIDTSIPSAYYTLRTDDGSRARQRVTRQWWDEYANVFILTSSPAVIEELSDGISEKTRDRIALVENLEILPITADIRQITQLYIDRFKCPKIRLVMRFIWQLLLFIGWTRCLRGTVRILPM